MRRVVDQLASFEAGAVLEHLALQILKKGFI